MTLMGEVFRGIASAQEVVTAAEAGLMDSLEYLRQARENLQAVANQSANPEHANAIALFGEAEIACNAIRARIAEFHPHCSRYAISLVGAPRTSLSTSDSPPLIRSSSPVTTHFSRGEAPIEPEFQLTNTGHYEAVADKVRNRPATQRPEKIEGYIAKGANSIVIDAGDGSVVKVLNDEKPIKALSSQEVDSKGIPLQRHELRVRSVEALKRCKGQPNTEQLVGYTPNDNDHPERFVFATKKVPGKTMKDATDDELAMATDEQCERLIDALEGILARDCAVDNNRGNIMYDPDAGFTIIDYEIRESDSGRQSIVRLLVDFASPKLAGFVKCREGGVLPPQASNLYRVVKRRLGKEAAGQMRQEWEAWNVVLPDEFYNA